jgi:hypothetical protein
MRDARRASLVVVAAVLAVLAPALLNPGGLLYPPIGQFSDLTITHWPAFEYLRDSLQNYGSLPLWRTSILGGTPFAADPIAGLWYPPNWLSIVLPLEWFFKLIFAAHLFLGGWGTMRLARSFGMGWFGAAASGVAYAIAPRAVGHVGAGHVTFVEAWAWIPLAVWGARRAGQSRAGLLVSGLALGLCALADLRAAMYAGLAVVSYSLLVNAPQTVTRLVAAVPRLAVALALAAWVSAASWLPAI